MDQSTSRLLELGLARASARDDADALYRPVVAGLVEDQDTLHSSMRSMQEEHDRQMRGSMSLFLLKQKETKLLNEALDFQNVELNAAQKIATMESETLHDMLRSQNAELDATRQMANNIRGQANFNTYRSNQMKKVGGSYGLRHDSTGLFTVLEWGPMIDEIKAGGTSEYEIIDTLTSGRSTAKTKRGELSQNKTASATDWFAPSRPANFEAAFKTAPNTVEQTYPNFGTLKGIKFGAITLFNFPKTEKEVLQMREQETKQKYISALYEDSDDGITINNRKFQSQPSTNSTPEWDLNRPYPPDPTKKQYPSALYEDLDSGVIITDRTFPAQPPNTQPPGRYSYQPYPPDPTTTTRARYAKFKGR